MGISEQLFGGLTIGFDHRLQSMAAQWIFDTIYVHSKVGLIKDKSCTLNVSHVNVREHHIYLLVYVILKMLDCQ